MQYDVHSLFAYSTVVSIISQTATTVDILVQPGTGATFSVNQQVVIWTALSPSPLFNDAMIGRVTSVVGDQLVINISTGNREGSNLRTVLPGDQVANAITPKILTDIETSTLLKSGGTMSDILSMGGNKITNLGTPTVSTDAATKAYVDAFTPPAATWGNITGTLSSQSDLNTALSGKEPSITSGSTMQYWRGDKTFQTLNTTIVTEGSNLYYTDARVRLNRLDQMAAPTVSVSLNSQKITNLLDPSNPQEAATKNYVDSVTQGLTIKNPVRATTTGVLPSYTFSTNVITASANGALPTQDGVTLIVNDRLLVQNETGGNQKYNGIYVVTQVGDAGTPFILTRSSDANTSGNVVAGLYTFVTEGTTFSDTSFVLTTPNPITLNTTALTFAEFFSAGQISAGTGLTKIGSVISLTSPVIVSLGGTGTITQFTAGSLIFSGASGIYSQDNTNLFWDNTNKRLGIGTNTPNRLLTIVKNVSIGLNVIELQMTDSGSTARTLAIGATNAKSYFGTTTNNDLSLLTNNTDVMYLTSGGSIGIGTTSPSDTLHISKAGTVGIKLTDTSASITGRLYNDANVHLDAGGSVLYLEGSTLLINSGNTNKVGINTTTPGSNVQINGNVAIGYSSYTAAPTNGLLVNGNIGVGLTSPTAILHLKAGTATANTAPLKFSSGTLLTTPEAGAVEFDGSHIYATIGATRYQLDQQTNSIKGSPSLLIAASNAAITIKNRADYVCTGTNDDVIINTALASLPAGGGKIILSEGVFNVGTHVLISVSNIEIQAQGTATILKQTNGANVDSVLKILGTNISQIKVSSLLIEGNSTNNTFGNGILMQTGGASNSWVILQDIVVQNCPNNGVAWNANPGSSSYYIQRVHSTTNGGSGFYAQYNSGAALTDSVFDSCIADTNALNGFFLTTLDTHFINCKSYFNGSAGGNNHGYFINGYNNYFTNCQAQDNYQSGFYSENGGDPTYGAQNCVFVNCDADSNNQSANASYGCGFQLKNVSGWTLDSCQAYERPYPFSWTQRIGVSLEGTTTGTRIIGLTGSGNSSGLYSDTSSGTNYPLHTQGVVSKLSDTIQLASLTTTQRNALTAVNGMVLYNSTLNQINKYENSQWVDISKSPATKVVAPAGSGFSADYYTTGTGDDAILNTAFAGGGNILIKKGSYSISSQLNPASNSKIIMEKGGIITVASGANIHAFGVANVTNVTLEINIDCNGSTFTGQFQGIRIGQGSSYITIKNSKVINASHHNISAHLDGGYSTPSFIRVQNCEISGAGQYGGSTADGTCVALIATDSVIENNFIVDTSFCAIELYAGGANNIAQNNKIVWNGESDSLGAISIQSGHNNAIVIGNTITGTGVSGQYAIKASGGNYGVVSGNTIYNLTNGGGIYIAGQNYSTFANNTIQGLSDTTNGYGMFIEGNYNNIVGNNITGAGVYGIRVRPNGKYNSFIGNHISLSQQHGIEIDSTSGYCTFIGNHIFNNGQAAANTYDGINGQAPNCHFNGNFCYDNQGTPTQRYGIRLSSSTANNFSLIDNDVSQGNISGGISLSSTGSSYDLAGNIGEDSFVQRLGNNKIAQLNDGSNASGIWGMNIGLISTGGEASIVTRSTTPMTFYTGGTLNTTTKGTLRMTFSNAGKLGIGVSSPTAFLHLLAGTATANTSPLKFTSGVNLTTPEDGAMEYDGTHLYFDIGATRYQIDQQSTAAGDVVGPASATNNDVVFFDGTTGKLVKDSGLTLSGSNTGDQTITLTGNVTGSGTGSFATIIAAGVVTNAMLAGSIASSKLVGTDIATVGTITSGTWTGTTIAVANGGTGQTSYTNGQLLIGNTTGNTLTKATLTAGNSITVTNGTGSITLDTIQDIRTSASPTFAGISLTGAETITSNSANALVVGRQGSTHPVLQIDASADSSITTGILIQGQDGGSGVKISAISDQTNEDLYIDSKGTGYIRFNTLSTSALFAIGSQTQFNKLTTTVIGGIGSTSTDGSILTNNSVAANNAQQFSPRLRLTGQGWRTNATAQSETVDWILENQPVQGTADPSTNLVTSYQVNAGGYSVHHTSLSSGAFNLANGGIYQINGTTVLSNNTLGSGVVNSSLTSVGTITTGVWTGTTIAVANGGTGTTSYTDGQLLIGNTTGNTLTKSTLTAGNSVTVTNGHGTITLDTIQDIRTSSSPTFTGLSLTGLLSINDTGNLNENVATAGIYLGQISGGGTERIVIANGTAAQNWEIDNSAGNLRFFQPGTVRINIDGSSNMAVGRSMRVGSTSNGTNTTAGDLQYVRGFATTSQFIGGTTVPSSKLHIAAGSSSANTAPFQLTSGTLETTARAGVMEYNNNLYFTSAGIVRYSIGGTIFDHFADAGNTHTDGSTFDDLYTDTTVANTLNTNGDKIKADYSGTFVGSTSTKEIKVLFAGTTILDSTALAVATAESWDIDIFIIRESSTVVRCVARFISTTATLTGVNTEITYTRITGLTLSGTNILKITGVSGGAGAAANDVVGKLATIAFIPAV